jgi:hypothetical protein
MRQNTHLRSEVKVSTATRYNSPRTSCLGIIVHSWLLGGIRHSPIIALEHSQLSQLPARRSTKKETLKIARKHGTTSSINYLPSAASAVQRLSVFIPKHQTQIIPLSLLLSLLYVLAVVSSRGVVESWNAGGPHEVMIIMNGVRSTE